MGGGEHHDEPHGAQEFRLKVWSMTGGPNCRPKYWRRNSAIAMFGIFLVCIPTAMRSAELEVRFEIALGIAAGLCYLHEGCQRRIIHRDIKASNILLTEDYQPQISDFGLAKWLPDKWTHHVVFPIEGTFGYMAPEYFMHGVVNVTDVFAFGVLLLELITGRWAVDSSKRSLVIWLRQKRPGRQWKELES